MSSTGYNSQNGGSGPPYSNGPVQGSLMYSPALASQGYNSVLPGSYPPQIPAKATQHPGHGQQNSSVPQTVPQLDGLQTVHRLSGPQNFPQLSNYPVSGQTFNRPPMGHTQVASSQHTGARPRMPSPPQNTAGEPAPADSNASQGNVHLQSNWQYFSKPQPFANHIYSSAGSISGQPSLQSNANQPTTRQYVTPFGGPPLQNSFMSQANSAPPGSDSSLHNSYDTIEGGGYMPSINNLASSVGGLSLHHSQQLDGLRALNLLQERNILPPTPLKAPTPCLLEDIQKLNCNPELFRCTLTNIPQTQVLLNKAKLPLGLLLHPFKDLSQLPVVTSSTIVRCRSCRTYINPFVSFLDQRRWKCNLCYRVNDVPEEFMYNPVTRAYGEPHKRPEVQNATIEFMAPSEYMLRPPQPPVYLFMLDVSHNALETSYLNTVCQTLLENLDWLPGNTRTKIGFITFDSTIHFYSLQEGLSQPQMLVVSDIDDVFIPMPENLLVNLNECKELVQDLLKNLPQMFTKSSETQSALGPALQAAFKLTSPTGGRITVFQTQLPSLGAGALKPREEPNQKSSAKEIHNLTPSTDFYKKLALDCSGQQISVDLFLLSGRYSDLASLGCISRYSAGSVYYYRSYHTQHNPVQVEKLQKELKRYLTRKIGFEAVMRIRCTRGLSIHTFHGNFFVRSTDLLSLPNVNPDAGYAVQMSVEENLTDTPVVSFQSALLYTSSKGERRIRVHTMCLPVVSAVSDVYAGADAQAITGLLANMAVDRSITSSLSDARDALVNAVIDSLSAYRSSVLTVQQPGLLAPHSLRLLPMFVLALLKQKAFQTGTNASLDERIFAMCQIKNQPLLYLLLMIHSNLYRVDNLTDEGALDFNDRTIPQPTILQLSVEKLNRDGAYLMDAGSILIIWVGRNCGQNFFTQVLGVANYETMPVEMNRLPELDTAESARAIAFISWLREQRPFFPTLHIIRDENPLKTAFTQNMIEDRTESALSYYEFLLHLQQQVNK
ncbi:protein transport protein Sec24A isoform X2 [Xenopus laevis]|uniref:Protein transport protein Sec24A isoform X2 n=1 Tax=Xenopus laevis TaxID=8355 RepID=A0A8J0UUL6_XENLA|nr:protein transport protein Sec24A isoform X2 [Xenopus laevis]